MVFEIFHSSISSASATRFEGRFKKLKKNKTANSSTYKHETEKI